MDDAIRAPFTADELRANYRPYKWHCADCHEGGGYSTEAAARCAYEQHEASPGHVVNARLTDRKPMTAPEVREAKEHLFEGPDPTVDLADSMQKIEERYRLVPVVGPPYSKDLRYLQIKGEWIAPGDVKASAKPCASPEGLPSFLDIPRMPILERVEMLNRLNSILQDAPYVGPAPVGPSKIDIDIDYAGEPNKRPSPKFHIEIERGIGIGCHVCPGFKDHAPDFDAVPALHAKHDATVEHDRNMEKMLRAEIEEARAGVETARTALYDYLKSKNRAA